MKKGAGARLRDRKTFKNRPVVNHINPIVER